MTAVHRADLSRFDAALDYLAESAFQGRSHKDHRKVREAKEAVAALRSLFEAAESALAEVASTAAALDPLSDPRVRVSGDGSAWDRRSS